MIVAVLTLSAGADATSQDLQQMLRDAQTKVVKIYGAGGFRGMEAYQTGLLLSSEGHLLTSWSYVLDTDDLVVILDDGRRWSAELVASDPVLELAVFKLPVEGETLPHFDLRTARKITATEGEPVFALSNLFGIATGDESVSVLHGVVTAIAPLDARRGSFRSNYRGKVYVVDTYTNNPGAAGGALINERGELIGVLGKELRSEVTGTWLNYALPIPEIADRLDDLIAGRVESRLRRVDRPLQPLSSEDLGLVLVPDLLPRTPPYVDAVRRDSSADLAGVRADDLIVLLSGVPIGSCRAFYEELTNHERDEAVTISILRRGELIEFPLRRSLVDHVQPKGNPSQSRIEN